MGFFKKLFKKKKGGSFFGNLIRGVANKATGGVLGNGVQLARRQAKEDRAEALKALRSNNTYQRGQTMGARLDVGLPQFNRVKRGNPRNTAPTNNRNANPDGGNGQEGSNGIVKWIKKNVLATVGIGAGILLSGWFLLKGRKGGLV